MFDLLTDTLQKEQLAVHAIAVEQAGNLLYRKNFDEDIRRPVYSVTKSLLSAVVGIAAGEGLVDIHRPLADYLPKKAVAAMPARAAFSELPMTRFLTMSVAGYPFRPTGQNWLACALSCAADYGTVQFAYSNIPAYLVGLACMRALSSHLMPYMQEKLLTPLAITDTPYQNDPQGNFYAATGMELTLAELMRFGALWMNEGGGIIPPEWVQAATSLQIANPRGGYGYYFWCMPHGFYMSGKWGQQCLIFPEKRLMIACLADEEQRPERLHELVCGLAEKL